MLPSVPTMQARCWGKELLAQDLRCFDARNMLKLEVEIFMHFKALTEKLCQVFLSQLEVGISRHSQKQKLVQLNFFEGSSTVWRGSQKMTKLKALNKTSLLIVPLIHSSCNLIQILVLHCFHQHFTSLFGITTLLSIWNLMNNWKNYLCNSF